MKHPSSSCAPLSTVKGRALRVSALLVVGLSASTACRTEDDGRGDVPTVSSTGGGGPGASGGNVDTSGASQNSTRVVPGVNVGADSETGAPTTVSNEPVASGSNAAGNDTGASGIGGGAGDDTGSADGVGGADTGTGSAIGEDDAPGGKDGLDGENSVTDAGSEPVANDGVSAGDSVTRTASTFTFRHFPIETNSDDVWSGAMTPGDEPISTTFDTVILENGYLRVTLLPIARALRAWTPVKPGCCRRLARTGAEETLRFLSTGSAARWSQRPGSAGWSALKIPGMPSCRTTVVAF